MRRVQAGFTLIEIAVVAAIAGLLAGIALPSYQVHLVKARRADATAALEQLQAAQERHHALHGLYASDLRALGASGRSPEGLYRVALQPESGDAYAVVAQALPDGPQAADLTCAEITLQVRHGFAQTGPDAGCWRR